MTFNRKSYQMRGGELSVVHFNADAGPVRLVFLHANGFNAQSYRELLTSLNVHSVALDMRGHGFTDLPTDIESLDGFQIFANDVVTFIDRYVPGKIVLSGHSFGATCGILASHQLRGRLVGYIGLDPVTVPPFIGYVARSRLARRLMKNLVPMAKNSGKRRRVFESRQQVFDRYKGRGVFKGMSDEALHNYLAGGLQEIAEGVELCCDPLWEQAIYCAQVNDIFGAARYLPDNSQIHYAGKQTVSTKNTRHKISEVIGVDKVYFHPDRYHMFPLQIPECTSGLLRASIDRAQ